MHYILFFLPFTVNKVMICKKDGVVLTHATVEAAKALGGSFKLVTLAQKKLREMTQLLRET